MTNLDSIFKSRDITLPTKVRLDKAMAFPVVIYPSKIPATVRPRVGIHSTTAEKTTPDSVGLVAHVGA